MAVFPEITSEFMDRGTSIVFMTMWFNILLCTMNYKSQQENKQTETINPLTECYSWYTGIMQTG